MKSRLFGAVTLSLCLFFATGATAGLIPGTVAYDAPLVNGVYFGSGNENTGFNVFTSLDGTLELGLGAIIRYQGPAHEVDNNYYVPVGQSTHDAQSAWGLTFSVDTQANNTGTGKLDDYFWNIAILDLSHPFPNFTFFSPALFPDTSFRKLAGANVGFQNSEAPSFSFISTPLHFNMNDTDTYKVTLLAINKLDPNTVASVQILVNAQTPEPATFGLIGSALLGLAFVSSRRLRRNK